MPQFKAPLRDQQFVIHELLQAVEALRTMPRYVDLDSDTVNQVVEEAGRFAQEVLLPLNQSGDEEGCRYDPKTHEVRTPAGFAAAYEKFREAGWQGLTAEEEFGGQALPHLLQIAFDEMRCATNQAWAMYPGLTLGAYECTAQHGSAEQKALYLPKLVSGEWTGTMCLTEPHCGTDLGLLRTKAEPQADGTYKITGSKIFISAGEHDMAANIVHLVLARLPDAPAGHQGHLAVHRAQVRSRAADGSACGARNGITCGAIEHKMGIHGNSTCQMVLGRGHRLAGRAAEQGPERDVRDDERRAPGRGHAGAGPDRSRPTRTRWPMPRSGMQMRSLSGAKAPERPADPIIVHPDVRRMLLTATAYAEGGRAFASLDRAADRPANSTIRTKTCARIARRPGGAADADRQGLHHRQRLDRHFRVHAGVRRPRLHPRSGAWSSMCAMRAST